MAVCTIEKANSALNRLVQEGRMHELCCIIVDEAHMVGDPQRGLPLELSLTKVRTRGATDGLRERKRGRRDGLPLFWEERKRLAGLEQLTT